MQRDRWQGQPGKCVADCSDSLGIYGGGGMSHSLLVVTAVLLFISPPDVFKVNLYRYILGISRWRLFYPWFSKGSVSCPGTSKEKMNCTESGWSGYVQNIVLVASSADNAQLLASELLSGSITSKQLGLSLGSSLSLPTQMYASEELQSAEYIYASTYGAKIHSVEVMCSGMCNAIMCLLWHL